MDRGAFPAIAKLVSKSLFLIFFRQDLLTREIIGKTRTALTAVLFYSNGDGLQESDELRWASDLIPPIWSWIC